MPEPGSHRYDMQRAHLREAIDEQGVHPDGAADVEADRLLRGPVPHPSPFSETWRAKGPRGGRRRVPGSAGPVMRLRSSAFNDQAPIPVHYTSYGADQPPVLEWADVPIGTRELVVFCEDLDAATGPFLHWLVSGIDPSTTHLGPDTPAGVQHANGTGSPGYLGPRVPARDDPHRYVFRLYALVEDFSPPDGQDAVALRTWLDNHAVRTGTLTGTYER